MSQANEKKMTSIQKFICFAGYCSLGGVGLAYFSYRAFLATYARSIADKPKKERLEMRKFKSYPHFKKSIALSGLYFIGFGLMLWQFSFKELVFDILTKKDQQYMNSIKVDPAFQDYHIIKKLCFFGISQRLIKKTQMQLAERIKNSNIPQNETQTFKLQKAWVQYVNSNKKKSD